MHVMLCCVFALVLIQHILIIFNNGSPFDEIIICNRSISLSLWLARINYSGTTARLMMTVARCANQCDPIRYVPISGLVFVASTSASQPASPPRASLGARLLAAGLMGWFSNSRQYYLPVHTILRKYARALDIINSRSECAIQASAYSVVTYHNMYFIKHLLRHPLLPQ